MYRAARNAFQTPKWLSKTAEETNGLQSLVMVFPFATKQFISGLLAKNKLQCWMTTDYQVNLNATDTLGMYSTTTQLLSRTRGQSRRIMRRLESSIKETEKVNKAHGGLSNVEGNLPDIRLFNEVGEFLGTRYVPGHIEDGATGSDVRVKQKVKCRRKAKSMRRRSWVQLCNTITRTARGCLRIYRTMDQLEENRESQ